jgi:Lon protease-like protein
MSKLLPLFPLQLVVFPGEELNLHVFEPRYRQLIQECEEDGATFGIPAYIEGKVMEVGTEIELLSVEQRYPDGEMDIKTRGLGLFHIREFYRRAPGKLYSAAEVEPLPFDTAADILDNGRILELLEELFALMKIEKTIERRPEDLDIYSLAHHVGFSLEQEYAFLRLTDGRKRQEAMLYHLERLLPIVREMENMRTRAQMNGHFKNIVPPDF